jgi:hypothetical protein
MVRAKNGQFIPVGGLWEKTATNGSGSFLQGQIDDPSFEAPLSVALFSQEDGALNVAWSRPRRRMEAAFGEATVTGSGNEGFTDHGAVDGDASPFGDIDPGLAKAA